MSAVRTLHLMASITIHLSAADQSEEIEIPASFRTDCADDPAVAAARELLNGEVTSGTSYDLLDTKFFTDALASRFEIYLYGRQVSQLLNQIGMHRLGKFRDGNLVRLFYSENPSKYRRGGRINPRAIKQALQNL